MKILVAGSSGVLGNFICEEVVRIFGNTVHLLVSDYKMDRGRETARKFGNNVSFQFLDANHSESIEQAVQHVDIVIVALKQSDPAIQTVCLKKKVLCIDVTVFSDFVHDVIALHEMAKNNDTASIVMAGFIPGLSGLLVRKAISDFDEVSEINIGFLQNTNAKAGVTGIVDMLSLVNQNVSLPNNSNIQGFTKKRKIDFLQLSACQKVRLIAHPEKEFLETKLPIRNLHYWTAWNSSIFNTLLSFLITRNLIPFITGQKRTLSKLVKHNPQKSEQAYVTVEVQGVIGNKKCEKVLTLSASSDYQTTAMMTAALAKIAFEKKAQGVLFPFEITDIDEVLSIIQSNDISLMETIR